MGNSCLKSSKIDVKPVDENSSDSNTDIWDNTENSHIYIGGLNREIIVAIDGPKPRYQRVSDSPINSRNSTRSVSPTALIDIIRRCSPSEQRLPSLSGYVEGIELDERSYHVYRVTPPSGQRGSPSLIIKNIYSTKTPNLPFSIPSSILPGSEPNPHQIRFFSRKITTSTRYDIKETIHILKQVCHLIRDADFIEVSPLILEISSYLEKVILSHDLIDQQMIAELTRKLRLILIDCPYQLELKAGKRSLISLTQNLLNRLLSHIELISTNKWTIWTFIPNEDLPSGKTNYSSSSSEDSLGNLTKEIKRFQKIAEIKILLNSIQSILETIIDHDAIGLERTIQITTSTCQQQLNLIFPC